MKHRLVRVATVREYLVPEGGQSTLDFRLEHLFRQVPFASLAVERSGFLINGSEELVSIEVTERSVDF